MKRMLGALLAILMTFSALPLCTQASAPGRRQISANTIIDTDGSDGYTGDYVVVYNPSEDPENWLTTGDMEGRIETSLECPAPAAGLWNDGSYLIDVDAQMAEKAREAGAALPKAAEAGAVRRSFEVGDTHTFVILNYSPAGIFVEFKVLAKGEHCYIWTPVSNAENVYPLDSIDPSFAQIAADTFDSKFDLMQEYFGTHDYGTQGDGRLNMLYYNIDDGWEPGQGYIGGYFYAMDYTINGMPILNIDTYPGVHAVTVSGEEIDDISRTFNTMVHEYQHLIQYSECGSTETWINECMSAAAEEICFPGSSVYPRIQSWTNHYYSEHQDWAEPPEEVECLSELELHNGYPLCDWSNSLEMDDLLVLYAQVSLFAQYVYSRAGNTAFRGIMEGMQRGLDFNAICPELFGLGASEFIGNFRVALTANTAPDEYGGIYSFSMQEGYDPGDYHGVADLYSLLCPVVFTSPSCGVHGGGAICIKPVGGVYYPPEDAAEGLVYFGITRGAAPQEHIPGDVDNDGKVDSIDALLVLRYASGVIEGGLDAAAADVNNDGRVDSADALMILRFALGIVPSL